MGGVSGRCVRSCKVGGVSGRCGRWQITHNVIGLLQLLPVVLSSSTKVV